MTTKVKAGVVAADAIESDGIKALAVTAAKLATDAVETAKIKDGAVTTAKFATGAVALPYNYIGGLKLSNDTDTDHDVNIAKGSARDATDTVDIALAAEITKRIDVSWAVGDDAGGMDTGSVTTSTMYYIWLIKRSDTAVVDALFSLSATAPTMPTNYDYKRLVGAVKTDGSSNIVQFVHAGKDLFIYTTLPQADIAGAAVTGGSEVTGVTLSAPPGSTALVYVNITNSGYTHLYVQLYATGGGESTTEKYGSIGIQGAGNIGSITAQATVLLDASKQCSYIASEGAGTATISISTYGFEMITRSDP